MQDEPPVDSELYESTANISLYEEIDLDPDAMYAMPIQNTLVMLENGLYEA